MSGLRRLLQERYNTIYGMGSSPHKLYGFYRGYVVAVCSSSDKGYAPVNHGRVRVRVPALHQTAATTPDSSLPWAEVLQTGGGLNDCGSYEMPYIGAKVLVVFEQGQPQYPLVVSTWRATPSKAREAMVAGEKQTNPSGDETPLDVDGHDDTRQVWHKSWKGHTIVCEEATGAEYLRVIDRAGNIIEMACPVPDAALRRGNGNAVDGGSVDPASAPGSYILIKDISGQEIRMTADTANPEVVITTTGSIRLGGLLSTMTFAVAKLLYAALRTVIIPLRFHSHSNGNNGSPTGPPLSPIPDLPDAVAWETPRIFGSPQ
jgi:hypothetical protein